MAINSKKIQPQTKQISQSKESKHVHDMPAPKYSWMKIPTISKHSCIKFLTISLMMIFIVYVYSILRVSKDAIIVSLIGEAELISTLKLYGVLPFAIIFMLVYTKLVDIFSKTQLFHIIIWFFIGFFALFSFVLFPNADSIHIDFSEIIQKMPYLKYVFLMFGKWSYTLFYIFSELWGTVILSLLFWQLANQINTVDEAKRFYPLFGMAGQIGLFASGKLITFFTILANKTQETSEKLSKSISDSASTISDSTSNVILAHASWANSLMYITFSIIMSGIILSICLIVLSKITGEDVINGVKSASGNIKKKIKMGFIQSLKYIGSSKYIGLIAMLILCYGISINLVEGLWKKSLGIMYPLPNDYAAFSGNIQMWTGIATMCAMLCGSFLLRILSWRTAALLTPIMILLTGLPFFLFMVYKEDMNAYAVTLGTTTLLIAVISGSAQNILSKATKYAFFDPTKEMSYIPLDEDLKAKGKAAADVIGGRLGKSGGAFIQVFLLQAFVGSTLLDLAPYMFAIFIVIMIIWFFSAFGLAKEFKLKSQIVHDV